MTNVEILITFLGSFSCIFLAFGLVRIKRKATLHKALSIMLLFVGFAYTTRGLGSYFDIRSFYYISYVCYLASVIPLMIFFEQAMQKNIPTFLKIGALLAIPSLFITLNVYGVETHNKSWKFSFILFMVIISLSMSVLSFLRTKKTKCKNEKSILVAFTLTTALTVVLVSVDQLTFFYRSLEFRFSSLAILIFNFFMASILFANGSFRMRNYLLKLSQLLISSLGTGLLIAFLLGEKVGAEYLNISLVIFASLLIIHITDKVFGISFRVNNEDTLIRLNSLSSMEYGKVLEAFSGWDEVKKVQLLTTSYLQEQNLDEVLEAFSSRIKVYHRLEIDQKLEGSSGDRNLFEALDYILRHTNTEFVVLLPQSQELLVASFSSMTNAGYLQDVLFFLGDKLSSCKTREASHV